MHACYNANYRPIGRMQRDADGTDREGFQVLIGGHLGLQPGCAKIVYSFVQADEIAAFIQNPHIETP